SASGPDARSNSALGRAMGWRNRSPGRSVPSGSGSLTAYALLTGVAIDNLDHGASLHGSRTVEHELEYMIYPCRSVRDPSSDAPWPRLGCCFFSLDGCAPISIVSRTGNANDVTSANRRGFCLPYFVKKVTKSGGGSGDMDFDLSTYYPLFLYLALILLF